MHRKLTSSVVEFLTDTVSPVDRLHYRLEVLLRYQPICDTLSVGDTVLVNR